MTRLARWRCQYWAYCPTNISERKFPTGTADTEFKRKFFELLEKAYLFGHEAGEIELFADAPEIMRFRSCSRKKHGE